MPISISCGRKIRVVPSTCPQENAALSYFISDPSTRKASSARIEQLNDVAIGYVSEECIFWMY